MKPWIKITALILGICFLLCLGGCGSESSDDTTAPTETTIPTTQPDPGKLYEAARSSLSSQTNLVLSYNLKQQRAVGGESYTTTNVGVASYAGLGTEAMTALVSEDLTFGSYETQYTQSYISGVGYCRVNNFNFSSEMTGDEFTAQQIPALLLDEALYADISAEISEAGTVLSFADPMSLESWIGADNSAEIINAYGSVTLDSSGAITAASYHAEYTLSIASYTVDIATTVSTPSTLDFSGSQPVYPEECIPVSDLSIPAKLCQAVGDVYSTNSISASYTDRLYSAAFASIRSQSSSFHTYGSGDDFICSMDTQVGVTDYTGTTTSNSQTITYIDGVYTNIANGGEPTTAKGVTAEQLRTGCEDSVLSALFQLDYIAGAEMTEEGDFLYIEFTGSESYANAMCDSIYSIFGVDLDGYAESYTTEAAGGYLILNRYTGLPTALGVNVGRSHTIDGVPYSLTYQLDQSIELASKSSYESITGQIPPETEPLQAASPLFYKVTGEDGHSMWLLGTIHVGDERTGYLPQQIMDAFNSADALAVEFDSIVFEETVLSDAALQAQLVEVYYYSDGSTTAKHLSEELNGQLDDLILASGSNSANAPYMKPAIWSSLIESFYLQQGSTLSASKGVDTRLLKLAKQQEKTIYEIESGLSQLQMLSNFSDAAQSMMLEGTLSTGLIGYCDGVSELYDLWCQGEETALSQYIAADTAEMSDAEKEYYKAMTTDRNKVMLKAAQKYLSSEETVFYAVGLAHLLGEDGLVAALRDAGYTVELVTYE